jgi:hypothetical protein
MGFQHTLYLKRFANEVRSNDANLDLPDHLDGKKYVWQSGASGFANTVSRFGTKVGDYVYEFAPHQVARILGALMAEVMEHYEVYDKAYEDYRYNVKYNEKAKADKLCTDSYAILRAMDKEMDKTSCYYYDEFNDSYRMFRIIKGLSGIASTMNEDDVLVWEAG